MSFEPYIHFQGTCRQALTAYQAIFGGEVEFMDYDQMPDADPAMKGSGRVMHGSLRTAGRSLMGSDFPPGMQGGPQEAVSISHEASSLAEAQRIYDALSEGGAPTMPFQKTFWADGFGMVKDRFGTHWMISAPWRQPG